MFVSCKRVSIGDDSVAVGKSGYRSHVCVHLKGGKSVDLAWMPTYIT